MLRNRKLKCVDMWNFSNKKKKKKKFNAFANNEILKFEDNFKIKIMNKPPPKKIDETIPNDVYEGLEMVDVTQ